MGNKLDLDLFSWSELKSDITHYKFPNHLQPADVEEYCSRRSQDAYYFDHNKEHVRGFQAVGSNYWDGWIYFIDPKDALIFKIWHSGGMSDF